MPGLPDMQKISPGKGGPRTKINLPAVGDDSSAHGEEGFVPIGLAPFEIMFTTRRLTMATWPDSVTLAIQESGTLCRLSQPRAREDASEICARLRSLRMPCPIHFFAGWKAACERLARNEWKTATTQPSGFPSGRSPQISPRNASLNCLPGFGPAPSVSEWSGGSDGSNMANRSPSTPTGTAV